MNSLKSLRILFLIICILIIAQESLAQTDAESEPIKRNNFILTIGHAVIPTSDEAGEGKDWVAIPTWGLSYEYRFSHFFLLGLKSELEISSYIIENDEGDELEREYPISLTLYADFRLLKGWYLYTGPGIEFESDENLYILSLGTYYEFELPGEWALVPEVCYTLKGGHTGAYSIGLGVCKTF